jgi:hypothetical protein
MSPPGNRIRPSGLDGGRPHIAIVPIAGPGQDAVPDAQDGLTPLARLQVEQARRALETLDDQVRGAGLAEAMLLAGELKEHAQFSSPWSTR